MSDRILIELTRFEAEQLSKAVGHAFEDVLISKNMVISFFGGTMQANAASRGYEKLLAAVQSRTPMTKKQSVDRRKS